MNYSKEHTVIAVSFTALESEKLCELSLNHPHHFVRRKALAINMKSHGLSHAKIAKIIGICENTSRSYCQAYQEKGLESVTAINFRQPESELISFKQVVTDYLTQSPPASIKQACAEIALLTGIDRKETQMRSYLKSLGAGFRKVGSIPAKADVAKQKQFKEEQLEPRLEEAKAGLRTVYFVDSAHFVLSAFLGWLWCISRIFVRAPSGRQRFNVLGALNAVNQDVVTVTNDSYITGTEVCELLKLLAQKNIESNTVCSESMESIVMNTNVATANGADSGLREEVIEDEMPRIELAILKTVAAESNVEEVVVEEALMVKSKELNTKKIKIKKDKAMIKVEKEKAVRDKAKSMAEGLKVVTPVTVVLDNAKYQRCLVVTALAKELGIELLFLPPYSPNLNLIERLWKFTKKHCLNSKYYSDFSSFQNGISDFLKNMHHTHAAELRSLLTLKFQTFTEEQVEKKEIQVRKAA